LTRIFRKQFFDALPAIGRSGDQVGESPAAIDREVPDQGHGRIEAEGGGALNDTFLKLFLRVVELGCGKAVLFTWFKSSDANHGTPETSVSGVYCV